MPVVEIRVWSRMFNDWLEGAVVELDGNVDATNPDGRARLRVPAGDYLLRASATDHEGITRSTSIKTDLRLTVRLKGLAEAF